ncbi:DUF5655 domain-containing protein [Streptomyces aidingensis]|uniref:Predicted transport protein n=1 Tax=Streptomyces aidingensis TaxID=910347 RepID=A0A1I1KUZ4_9ACTN|nr:DUF5655 domain-containing protein [Streptomyces aidingensis]SFC62558.1 Predicted transport protein [Streptomyces aidingensis]
MQDVRLFSTKNGVAEVAPRLAEAERHVQDLVEAHMETLLGVRFLASEYHTGPVHGGRIDTLGLDENGVPAVVEYKRGTDPGVINQGLYYLAWLRDHQEEFRNLVRVRLGASQAAQVTWSAPRLICVAGGFTRYDLHAVREHRRAIDLVRYRFYGDDLFGLETVASVAGRRLSRAGGKCAGQGRSGRQSGRMLELRAALDEVLLGLGEDVTRIERRTYRAYQRLRNFACVCPPRRTKLLVYLKVNPEQVDLVPGFTRDVRGLGHHGTGDLEVELRSERELERAQELLRLSYAAE